MRAHGSVFALGIGAACIPLMGPSSDAATATNTFAAAITVQSSCVAVSTNILDFGGGTGLMAADVQTNIALQCTDATPFNVGLDAGSTPGGLVAEMLMSSGGTVVGYKLYSDATRAANWGNTVGTDTVSGVGSRGAVGLTVYGRVAPQPTSAPGTYTDPVTVTITY